jgi:hypothetical protein
MSVNNLLLLPHDDIPSIWGVMGSRFEDGNGGMSCEAQSVGLSSAAKQMGFLFRHLQGGSPVYIPANHVAQCGGICAVRALSKPLDITHVHASV